MYSVLSPRRPSLRPQLSISKAPVDVFSAAEIKSLSLAGLQEFKKLKQHSLNVFEKVANSLDSQEQSLVAKRAVSKPVEVQIAATQPPLQDQSALQSQPPEVKAETKKNTGELFGKSIQGFKTSVDLFQPAEVKHPEQDAEKSGPKVDPLPAFTPTPAPAPALTDQFAEKKQHIIEVSFEMELLKVVGLRKQYFERQSAVQQFSKNKFFKTPLNHALSQVTLLSNTVRSLFLCYHGTAKRNGPKLFLQKIMEKKPEFYAVAQQAVAGHIIHVFSSTVNTGDIKAGQIKFGLVYLSIALCLDFDGFYETLMGTIYAKCPYSFPGLMHYVLEHLDENEVNSEHILSQLGRKKGEADAEHVLKMQAIVSFQAAFFQTKPSTFDTEVYQNSALNLTFIPREKLFPGSFLEKQNGEAGIVFCWRFLAGHLNGHLNRFLPYVLVAFFAVAGFEMCKQINPVLVKKLLEVIVSKEFADKCRKHGHFETNDVNNDFDRFSGFQAYFQEQYNDGKLRIIPPGKKKDARLLEFEMEHQESR